MHARRARITSREHARTQAAPAPHLLRHAGLGPQLDGEGDELRVLLDQALQCALERLNSNGLAGCRSGLSQGLDGTAPRGGGAAAAATAMPACSSASQSKPIQHLQLVGVGKLSGVGLEVQGDARAALDVARSVLLDCRGRAGRLVRWVGVGEARRQASAGQASGRLSGQASGPKSCTSPRSQRK